MLVGVGATGAGATGSSASADWNGGSACGFGAVAGSFLTMVGSLSVGATVPGSPCSVKSSPSVFSDRAAAALCGVPTTTVSTRMARAGSWTNETGPASGGAGGPRPIGVSCRGRAPGLGKALPRLARLEKKGSSSAIVARRRGRPTPRLNRSSWLTLPTVIAALSSRSDRYSSSRPLTVLIVHSSGTEDRSGFWTLNLLPHCVQRTLVPWSDTKASSNSYSVPHFSQVTSILRVRDG